MRSEKDFEEYVKALGRKKRKAREARIAVLRKAAVIAGGSFAACLCIFFLYKGSMNSDLASGTAAENAEIQMHDEKEKYYDEIQDLDGNHTEEKMSEESCTEMQTVTEKEQ